MEVLALLAESSAEAVTVARVCGCSLVKVGSVQVRQMRERWLATTR
jgi:hypothetical protein